MTNRAAETDLIADLRRLSADGRCLCSSAHTDWRGVEDLLDRLERAEERVRRVEGAISAYQSAHSHLGIHRDQFGPSVGALRAALDNAISPESRGGDHA